MNDKVAVMTYYRNGLESYGGVFKDGDPCEARIFKEKVQE